LGEGAEILGFGRYHGELPLYALDVALDLPPVQSIIEVETAQFEEETQRDITLDPSLGATPPALPAIGSILAPPVVPILPAQLAETNLSTSRVRERSRTSDVLVSDFFFLSMDNYFLPMDNFFLSIYNFFITKFHRQSMDICQRGVNGTLFSAAGAVPRRCGVEVF
jgi:hypothetical protein